MTSKNSSWWQWNALPQWIAHQAAWWACLLLMGWQGALAMLAFVLVHGYVNRATLKQEITLIVGALLMGTVLDNLLAVFGLVDYEGKLYLGYAPLWLIGLWVGLGATLGHSQVVMIRSLPRAIIVGGVAGPLAYLGGARLERLYIQGTAGFFATSLGWAAVLAGLHLLWVRTRRPLATE